MKDVKIEVVVSADMKSQIKAAAEEEGLSMSGYLRKLFLDSEKAKRVSGK